MSSVLPSRALPAYALPLAFCALLAACSTGEITPGAPRQAAASEATTVRVSPAEPVTATAATPALSPAASAGAAPWRPDQFGSFAQWPEVQAFADHMAATHGFSRPTVQAVLNDTRLSETAIRLMQPAPPGRAKDWRAYRARFITPVRIDAGVAFWNTHADALARAEQTFGVPPEIIVGILGVETLYGRITGNFRVIDAVATLAFAYPDTPTRAARMQYFKGELESALLFAREYDIDPFSLLGSYAGAVGWPQFMPSSIRAYAVDFDGDNLIDLRNSPVDAIGSVANFLVKHGWKKGEPLVFPARVTSSHNAWERFIGQGLSAKFGLEEMRAGGVDPAVAPPADMRYSLVDLQNGDAPTEYWLGANNFFAITLYNRSYFYAMSVIDLGKAVRVARNL